jgi:hypothetical protein
MHGVLPIVALIDRNIESDVFYNEGSCILADYCALSFADIKMLFQGLK